MARIQANANRRKLSEGDDELARAFEDLKASIEKAIHENSKYRLAPRVIELPRVYKVVSRGDDEWRR